MYPRQIVTDLGGNLYLPVGKMNPSYFIQFNSLLGIKGSAQVIKYSNTILYLSVYQDIPQAVR